MRGAPRVERGRAYLCDACERAGLCRPALSRSSTSAAGLPRWTSSLSPLDFSNLAGVSRRVLRRTFLFSILPRRVEHTRNGGEVRVRVVADPPCAMSAAKCRCGGLPPRKVPRRMRSGGPLRAAAAAAAVCLVAAFFLWAPLGCRGKTASRSEIVEPPWGPPSAPLSTTRKGRASAAANPIPRRGLFSQRLTLNAAPPFPLDVAAESATTVRQQGPRVPANSPKPTSHSKDYETLELPRRQTGQVYYYTRLILVEPVSAQVGSNFGITALRTAIGKRLGGFSAEQVVMVHVGDLPARSTATVTARSVSIFMALRPSQLPQSRIDAFNDQVEMGAFDRDLQAEIPPSTSDAALFSVEQDRPLVKDEASMLTHGPSGHPRSRSPAPAPQKSKLPVIVGAVGAVVAVVVLVGVGWCVHARRSAARVASPRDLTRYSEESGTRQSSFPSSLASLPLPSFRSSIERPRKAHPDDMDRAA